MDELKTYVFSKHRKVWVVYAIERQTRQVADFKVGCRSNKTLKVVIGTLVLAHAKRIYTDGLINCSSFIPKAIHKVNDFGTNLSLRNSLKRLNRKTICYSKSRVMLEACLKIYYWRNARASN